MNPHIQYNEREKTTYFSDWICDEPSTKFVELHHTNKSLNQELLSKEKIDDLCLSECCQSCIIIHLAYAVKRDLHGHRSLPGLIRYYQSVDSYLVSFYKNILLVQSSNEKRLAIKEDNCFNRNAHHIVSSYAYDANRVFRKWQQISNDTLERECRFHSFVGKTLKELQYFPYYDQFTFLVKVLTSRYENISSRSYFQSYINEECLPTYLKALNLYQLDVEILSLLPRFWLIMDSKLKKIDLTREEMFKEPLYHFDGIPRFMDRLRESEAKAYFQPFYYVLEKSITIDLYTLVTNNPSNKKLFQGVTKAKEQAIYKIVKFWPEIYINRFMSYPRYDGAYEKCRTIVWCVKALGSTVPKTQNTVLPSLGYTCIDEHSKFQENENEDKKRSQPDDFVSTGPKRQKT